MAEKKKKPVKRTAKQLSNNKATLRKKMKLEMLKYCQIWGFGEAQTITYFEQRGEKLSHTHYYELKEELESQEMTDQWYTEQALIHMETTHKKSVEQIDELIKTTMAEIQQLQATPVYITYLVKGKKEPQLKFNPQHNSIALAKMMETLTSLFKSRDDMLAATPMVKAIMQKKALDEAENQAKGIPGRT